MDYVDGHATTDDALYVESWGTEVRSLYATPATPERVTDLATAVRTHDEVWVIVTWDRSLPHWNES